MDRQDSRQPKLEFEGMKRVRYSRYTQTRRVPVLSIQLLAPCFSPSAFLPHDLVLLLPRPLLLSIALTISEHTTLFDQFSSPWASKDMSEQVPIVECSSASPLVETVDGIIGGEEFNTI
ncbi:uncharacterized protein LOC122313666 [Carya illinoinensis]|uniref:uncharacterized protein LOC122313666 n=1 Tax=Carya illinoinensis TaxID=32201 RepID=UPI001C726CAB|nr:uncharacterized protein LOC122313666 [Carya illinoinensis]